MKDRKGPIESRAWPEKLEAVAIDGENAPRLHGYDVHGDLARHYRHTDVVLLALTGELPDDARSRAFELALTYCLPVSVANASVHGAVLAAFCGARPSLLLGASAASLAEEAMLLWAQCKDLFDGGTDLPESLQSRSREEDEAVARLRDALAGTVDVPILARRPGRDAALFAVLYACGLRSQMQCVAAVVLARLPSAIAEASPRSPRDILQKYPMTVPPFAYTEK